MSGRRITALSVTSSVLVLLVAGCASQQGGGADGVLSDAPMTPSGPTAKRFRGPSTPERTAVESAIELSEKYARLSDQAATLREQNQSLAADNARLRQQVADLESQLTRTQKELREANDLLIEMLTELNNWKSNILGFRNEMREAAKAQLEALLKVLEILGGEAAAPPAEPEGSGASPAGPTGAASDAATAGEQDR